MQRTLATEAKLMPENMIIGIATGGCPHTAVREDPSINLAVIDEIEAKDPSLDLILIERLISECGSLPPKWRKRQQFTEVVD